VIELVEPFGRVIIRPDGSINLADLAKPFEGGPPKPAPPPGPSAPLRLFIDRLALIGGRVSFEDRTHPTAFTAELSPVNLELRDFNTVATGGDAYTLTGATPEGEKFKWSGTLGVTPVASRGHFEVSQLRARTIWSYLRSSVPFELSSGVLDVTGDYEFTTAGKTLGLTLAVRDVGVSDLGVKPAGGAQDYVHLAQLQVHDTHIDLAQRSVNVGPVRLSGGVIHAWLGADGALNLSDLYATKAGAAGAASAQPPPSTYPCTAPTIGLKMFTPFCG